MSKISSLHNIKHKAAIGSGAMGIGLGTLLVAIAPRITDDAKIIETLRLLSPSVSIVGAYIIRTYYLVWAASKIETKIDRFLENPGLSQQHIQNLKTKREEMQRKQIESMEQGLINDEDASITAPNKSLKRTS